MRFKICPKCKTYTLYDICPNCGTKTIEFKTLKYSPEDKFQKYRLAEKRKLIQKGLL